MLKKRHAFYHKNVNGCSDTIPTIPNRFPYSSYSTMRCLGMPLLLCTRGRFEEMRLPQAEVTISETMPEITSPMQLFRGDVLSVKRQIHFSMETDNFPVKKTSNVGARKANTHRFLRVFFYNVPVTVGAATRTDHEPPAVPIIPTCVCVCLCVNL